MSFETLAQLQSLDSWSSRKINVICINVIEETPDVKTFQFKAEPQQLFHFKPGQFIGIQLEIDNEKHNRSYTIASSPTRPHLLELTIKLEESGIVSPWLHKNITRGSHLELRGPAGRFNCLDIQSDKVLLISAGSGVTPVMSMARFWLDSGANKDIQFLNWARATQDIIFRRELSLMDHLYPLFKQEVICTKPGLTENWLGRRGRINKNLLVDIVPDLNQRTIFCCGPEGFMEQVKSCLKELNFDMTNYHDESFDPGGKKKKRQQKIVQEQPNLNPNPGPFQLTLNKSGRKLELEAHENLLERLETEGVDIESACRAGNCGCCRVKKVSGNTDTQNETGLDKESQQDGYILTCTTNLKSDVVLDI